MPTTTSIRTYSTARAHLQVPNSVLCCLKLLRQLAPDTSTVIELLMKCSTLNVETRDMLKVYTCIMMSEGRAVYSNQGV